MAKASTSNSTQGATNVVVVDEASTKTETTKARKSKPKLSLTDMVYVINNTRGPLIYKSARNLGYQVEWSQYGDEEPMELSEVISMRNSQRRFFEKNWILIRDEEVLKYLGVEKMYEAMLGIGSVDDIFGMTPDEIKEKLQKAPQGLKDTISLKSKALIEAKQLNDLTVINAIEDVLGYKLIEIIS